MRSVPRCYKEDVWSKSSERERIVGESVKRRLGAVEELPLLGAVTRKRLVKTQQTEKISGVL
jgi:hypothetical protein